MTSGEEETREHHVLVPADAKVGKVIRFTEELFFAMLIFGLIVVGLIPIILRYTSSTGVTWTETLSHHVVLWIALLGAGTAVRERSSIAIDVVSQLMSSRYRLILRGITELVSAVICGILVWVSIRYVSLTLEFDADKKAFLWVYEWWLTLALPFGFFLLALRMLIAAIQDFLMAFDKKRSELQSERVKT